MAKRLDQASPGMQDPVTSNDISSANHGTEPPNPASLGEPPRPLAARYKSPIDWRKIDPSEIQGEGIPLEELRYYRETIDELLKSDSGRYVLLVGRELIGSYPDFESAARDAARFDGKSVLVKKVVAIEPVQTFGGVIG